MITHTIGGVIRPRIGVVRPVVADTRLDEAIALRRCAMHRKVFRGTAVSYPAEVLRFECRRGLDQGTRSSRWTWRLTDELDLVRMTGDEASRVVMHCHGEVPVSIRRAALSRFVVDSGEQIADALPTIRSRGRQHVVVDAGSVGRACERGAVAQAAEHCGLALLGSTAPSGATCREPWCR